MKKELHVQLKLTVKDLWQFAMYHGYFGMSGIFAVIFTLASLFLMISRWSTLDDFQKVLLVICLLIFTVWQPLLLYHKALRQSKRDVMKIPMDLFFSEEGLLVRQSGQEVRFTWDQIGRIDRMPTMAIIYMDRIHAYLLPHAVLSADQEAFYEMAKKYLPAGRTRRF